MTNPNNVFSGSFAGGFSGDGAALTNLNAALLQGLGSASFTQTSDRYAKENFRAVDPRQVLDKVAELPISQWNFKGDPTVHLGPWPRIFTPPLPSVSTTSISPPLMRKESLWPRSRALTLSWKKSLPE